MATRLRLHVLIAVLRMTWAIATTDDDGTVAAKSESSAGRQDDWMPAAGALRFGHPTRQYPYRHVARPHFNGQHYMANPLRLPGVPPLVHALASFGRGQAGNYGGGGAYGGNEGGYGSGGGYGKNGGSGYGKKRGGNGGAYNGGNVGSGYNNKGDGYKSSAANSYGSVGVGVDVVGGNQQRQPTSINLSLTKPTSSKAKGQKPAYVPFELSSTPKRHPYYFAEPSTTTTTHRPLLYFSTPKSSSTTTRRRVYTTYAPPTRSAAASIMRDSVMGEEFLQAVVDETGEQYRSEAGQPASSQPSTVVLPALILSDVGAEMPAVVKLNAQCDEFYIDVEIGFNASFRGLIYSVGYETQEECLYVRGNGLRDYELRVPLDGCGSVVESNAIAGSDSRSDVVNQLYVQNDRQLQEPWDDLFALRCERAPQQYRKRLRASLAGVELGAGRSVVASHPFGSYQAPICEMELQLGHGPSNPRVDGPVPFGQALTLVVRMAGTVGAPKYAMAIRSCFASDGASHRLELIDARGCALRPKLLSTFAAATLAPDADAGTATHYAFMRAFRFTGIRTLYIECDVIMCRDQCQLDECVAAGARSLDAVEDEAPNERSRRVVDTAAAATFGDGAPDHREFHQDERQSIRQAIQVLTPNEWRLENSAADQARERALAAVESATSVCLERGKLAALLLGFVVLVVGGCVGACFCCRGGSSSRRHSEWR